MKAWEELRVLHDIITQSLSAGHFQQITP